MDEEQLQPSPSHLTGGGRSPASTELLWEALQGSGTSEPFAGT